MHIQAWIWWQGILLQSQFSLFLCILKPEAYAQKLDRSKTPAQLHIMNWHPDSTLTSWLGTPKSSAAMQIMQSPCQTPTQKEKEVFEWARKAFGRAHSSPNRQPRLV